MSRKPKNRKANKSKKPFVHPVVKSLIGYHMTWKDKTPLVPGNTIYDDKKSHKVNLWRMDMNYMSQLVKEIARYRGDVSSFCPPVIEKALVERLHK